MELITAQTLWKDYNPRNIPLSETVLSTEYTDKYSVKHVYFNGEATGDGCTRIYARLYSPASIPTGASAVLMNDIETPFDPTYIDMLIDCGYTVLALDYAGKRDEGRFTIYPESLKRANYFTPDSGFYKLPSNPKLSCWYVYASVMLRGFIYLENQPGLDKNRICFFGVKRGAFQVYKAAYLMPEAACAAALFNSAYVPELDVNSDEAMVYNTCLSNATYAPLIKIPTYIIESSNNHENSLFKINSIYLNSSQSCRFYIAEHSDNSLNADQRKSLISFLNNMCFAHSELPKPPVLEAKNSDKALYYESKFFDAQELAGVNLYYSYGAAEGAYRNWSRLNLQRVSEDEYIVKADVYLLKDEVSAYVTAAYKNGFIISSEIVTKTPMLMGVAAKEIVKSRLVYDTEMGTDDWLITLADASGEIYIAEGGNGISGVTSSVNSITTLKIGDVHTCGERDSLLQLLVYSKRMQSLTVLVTCRTESGYVTYTASMSPQNYEEWSKITLSADEFKSPEGPMQGWNNAVSITVNSESELLINSLLWI
ncbi:MAG: hypothetical protein ACLTEK_00150 [Christensenellales bacterium]